MDALGVKLLQRLPSSLMAAEGMVTVGDCNELRGFWGKVALSFGVLEELRGCTDLALADESASTTNRKKQKVSVKHLRLDSGPFNSMGIPAPVTDRDARITYDEILLILKDVLGVRISPRLARFETLTCFRITYSSSGDPEYQTYSSADSKSRLPSS